MNNRKPINLKFIFFSIIVMIFVPMLLGFKFITSIQSISLLLNLEGILLLAFAFSLQHEDEPDQGFFRAAKLNKGKFYAGIIFLFTGNILEVFN